MVIISAEFGGNQSHEIGPWLVTIRGSLLNSVMASLPRLGKAEKVQEDQSRILKSGKTLTNHMTAESIVGSSVQINASGEEEQHNLAEIHYYCRLYDPLLSDAGSNPTCIFLLFVFLKCTELYSTHKCTTKSYIQ